MEILFEGAYKKTKAKELKFGDVFYVSDISVSDSQYFLKIYFAQATDSEQGKVCAIDLNNYKTRFFDADKEVIKTDGKMLIKEIYPKYDGVRGPITYPHASPAPWPLPLIPTNSNDICQYCKHAYYVYGCEFACEHELVCKANNYSFFKDKGAQEIEITWDRGDTLTLEYGDTTDTFSSTSLRQSQQVQQESQITQATQDTQD